MDEPPLVQEGSPTAVPFQCFQRDNHSSSIQNWQHLNGKIQNSKLLFLTVEYVHGANDVNMQGELNNSSATISENERIIDSLDLNTTSTTQLSHLYNTLVITTNGQSQYQNSFLVLPQLRNNSQQISVLLDDSQEKKISGATDIEIGDKLNSTTSQLLVHSEGISYNEESSLSEKLIAHCSRAVAKHKSLESAVNHSVEDMNDNTCLFQACNIMQNEYPTHTSHCTMLLSGTGENEDKALLKASKYDTNDGRLKGDELLLSDSEQNSELLMKSEGLMEVDAYNLTQTAYLTSDDGNSYRGIEEQLNINDIGKVENEYLLTEAMDFGGAETNLLQTNLEAFTSQVMDTSGFLLYDKTRLRPVKKNATVNLGLDYWCENCELGTKCGRHEMKIVSDKPVLTRARATLPKELLAINKLIGDGNEEGVFARKTIMRRVQFGPVEGRIVKDWDAAQMDPENIQLLLEVETGELLKLDVSDEYETNWMRFVRKAKTLKEQNMILTQQGKSLYFTTTRLIPPRHELKVGYGLQYAERRKLKVLDDLSWSCFECTSTFASSDELQKHLNNHENGKDKYNRKKNKREVVRVKESEISNNVRTAIRGRTRNESNEKSVKENECRTCHKNFPKTYSLKRHLLLVHSTDKNKENSSILKNLNDKVPITKILFKKKSSNGSASEWLCTHCNLTFDNPSVLNLHTLTHAAEDLESEAVLGLPSELSSVYHEGEFLIQNGDIQCPQCTQEFSSKRELIDHVSTHGKMMVTKLCNNPSKPYKCDRCYKSFATALRLQKHMLVHGSEEIKPYQCDTCFKRFLNNSALSCHLKTHNDKKCFECPICKKEFKQVFGLKEHVKIHSTDGFFTCPHCNKVFDGYSVVRKHIRAFHSGYQHVCRDCGKLCPTLDKLRMHSLKHSDHREFLCANCGKQFKRKDKLKEHMKRLHSAEREMKMMSSALRIPSTKDRRFTPKVSPMTYDRFIYKCRNCMVGFKRRGMLVNHLAKRHPDIVPNTVPELNLPILKTTRDYFCQYCDKIYKSSSKRKAHILKNHPGAELPMSNRQKGGIPHVPGIPNPTYSQTVGSVKTTPHGCKWCHKQYASKAKLLQHQRKKHSTLLPQGQQTTRLSKNSSSPNGSKHMENSGEPPNVEKLNESENNRQYICSKIHLSESEVVDGGLNIGNLVGQNLDLAYKKCVKSLPENVSCELLDQAMTELSQSFSDYKLPFAGTQESLFKMMELKDTGDCGGREESTGESQVSRTWPDLSPYPPR
ncbi:hypothetical protein RUM44_011839 [Polyplax serrata]|uniref:Uncharacterized protein n=1 Tax=Polyplax serrata TaxID=468196 RepID=A0ABR1B9M0_POLSC